MKNLKYEFGDFLSNVQLQNLMLPTHIVMVLTKTCNLKCKFCSAGTSGSQEMDYNFAKNFLLYCKKNGIHSICFSGGEPLLYPHINELIYYANSLNLNISLTTNGTLLNRLSSTSIKMLNKIGVSLHGTEKTHDSICGIKNSYKKTITNLEKIKNSNVNINYTFSNLNSEYHEIEHVANIAKQHNMSMSIARVNKTGRALYGAYDIQPNILMQNVSKLLSRGYDLQISNCISPCSIDEKFRYLAHGCSAGTSFAGIEPNGDVKICPTASFAIGNLYKEDFLHIWNNKSMLKLKSLTWLPLTCKTCYDLSKCRGGCKIENYSPTTWPAFGDSLANNVMENIWSCISNKKLELVVTSIRHENKKTILLGPHIRICNSLVVSILKTIDDKTGNQIIEHFDEKQQKDVKILLIALFRDSVIKTKDGIPYEL